MQNIVVVCGDNIEVLKQYPDNHFDSVVTDPPYGLGKEPDAYEVMKDWIQEGYHEIKGKGFMGKEWDSFVPQPLFWKEVFRVLKYGGHVLAFYGTRTYDWGVMAMRFAGFEIRDTVYWHYGTGFPKSHNISKAIDKYHGAEREIVGQREDILKKQAKDLSEGKRKIAESFNKGNSDRNNGFKNVSADITAPATEEAQNWDGWGTALKPASEPIVLARKPLEKGLSIAENVLKWGTGGINIDGCRVSTSDKITNHSRTSESSISKGIYGDSKGQETHQTEGQKLGRFPANLILTHHPDCVCNGFKKVKGSNCSPKDIGKGRNGDFSNGIYGEKSSKITVSHTDENGEELVEDWSCHEDCPIKILDEQSDITKSGKDMEVKGTGGILREGNGIPTGTQYGDTAGASRFFYVAKASSSERNLGLDDFEERYYAAGNQAKAELKRGNTDFNSNIGKDRDERNNFNQVGSNKNHHPTVKPVKLMQYLVKMITPKGGLVLDPFCGSGTTGIACKLEGFNAVLIEREKEYVEIADARVKNYVEIEGKKTSDNRKEEERELDGGEEEKGFTQLSIF